MTGNAAIFDLGAALHTKQRIRGIIVIAFDALHQR